jgi:hypothetical protein
VTKGAKQKRQHRTDYVLRKTSEKAEALALLDVRVLADYRMTRSWAETARNFDLTPALVKSSVRRASATERRCWWGR